MHRLPYQLEHHGLMKTAFRFAILLCPLVIFQAAGALSQEASNNRLIICLLPLEHADAEQLRYALTPFLSPQGKMAVYTPTNTLVIKDFPAVVRMLITAVKGKPDLSECENVRCVSGNEKETP